MLALCWPTPLSQARIGGAQRTRNPRVGEPTSALAPVVAQAGGGPVGLSSDPVKRERQLANLRRGGTASPGRPSAHGAYAVIAVERLEKREVDVFTALAGDAPLRNSDGSLPAADAVVVRLLAECLCRLDTIGAHLRDRGILDEKGNVKPVVEVEGRLRREAADHASALGMTPASRSKIGMDLIRAEVAAQSVEGDREARARLDRRFDALDELGPASVPPEGQQHRQQAEDDEEDAERHVDANGDPGDADGDHDEAPDQPGARTVHAREPTKGRAA